MITRAFFQTSSSTICKCARPDPVKFGIRPTAPGKAATPASLIACQTAFLISSFPVIALHRAQYSLGLKLSGIVIYSPP